MSIYSDEILYSTESVMTGDTASNAAQVPQIRPLFKTAMPAAGKRIGGFVNWRGDWAPWSQAFGGESDDSSEQLLPVGSQKQTYRIHADLPHD